MLVVSYIDTMLQYQDSSGVKLTVADTAGAQDLVSRLILSHKLPRMLVMGGVQTWRSYAVCHRSCMGQMNEADIHIKKINIFTGSRGNRARIGVLLKNATDIREDLIDGTLSKKDDFSYRETPVDVKLPVSGTDMWLECDYNTVSDTSSVTLLGGLGLK